MKLSASRRGDLTLNTIVIAALVLIVLVVLIMIFTGRISIFGKNLQTQEDSCMGKGGKICASGTCGGDSPEEYSISEYTGTEGTCCSLLAPC